MADAYDEVWNRKEGQKRYFIELYNNLIYLFIFNILKVDLSNNAAPGTLSNPVKTIKEAVELAGL